VTFDILTVVTLRTAVLCDVTPCVVTNPRHTVPATLHRVVLQRTIILGEHPAQWSFL